MNEYLPSRQCSICKIKESNMYYFTRTTKISEDCIVLCNDCVGRCLNRLFIHPASNAFKLIQEFINENSKKTI